MPRIPHEQMPVAGLERAALGGPLATTAGCNRRCSGARVYSTSRPARDTAWCCSLRPPRRAGARPIPRLTAVEVARRYPQETKRERPCDLTSSASSSAAVSSALLPGWFVAARFDDRRAASRSLRLVWRRASHLAWRKRCRRPRRRPCRPPRPNTWRPPTSSSTSNKPTPYRATARRSNLPHDLYSLENALTAVRTFLGPLLTGRVRSGRWNPDERAWM